MPKLPRKVTIGNVSYQIKVVDELKNDDGSPIWGWWRPVYCSIELNKDITGTDNEPEVLLHEILHAIVDCCDLFHRERPLPKEEVVVSSIAKGLAAVLKNNKQLRDYIASIK